MKKSKIEKQKNITILLFTPYFKLQQCKMQTFTRTREKNTKRVGKSQESSFFSGPAPKRGGGEAERLRKLLLKKTLEASWHYAPSQHLQAAQQ